MSCMYAHDILEQDDVGEPACTPQDVPIVKTVIDCCEIDIVALTTDPGCHQHSLLCVLLYVYTCGFMSLAIECIII